MLLQRPKIETKLAKLGIASGHQSLRAQGPTDIRANESTDAGLHTKRGMHHLYRNSSRASSISPQT